MLDISDTILADSTQLNAADLAEPIVVRILGAKRHQSEDRKQPTEFAITGHMPWLPCKGMRRVLVALWGKDASAYVGRWLRLFNDPSVTYGKDKPGGIRIGAMSNIAGAVDITVPTSRGKYATYRIEKMEPPSEAPSLVEVLDRAGLTVADLDNFRAREDKCPVADLSEEQRQTMAATYDAHPEKLRTIQAATVKQAERQPGDEP
jgi:hypothetical protein